MRFVISGATGFLGHALVEALLERGDTVVALSRDAEKARQSLGSSVECLEWRPPGPGPWTQALNGADGIVNLAGEPVANKRWTERQKERVMSSRVDATRAIVDAVRSAEPRPRVLVNQSAVGYYGSPGETPVTESSPAGDDFLAHVVKEWEKAAKPAEDLDVRLMILRTGIVLGRGGGALIPMALPFRFFMGGTMGDPNQWFSWIHLDDEIGLIVRALTQEDMHGVWNATAPNPVTMRELSQQIGKALGRPIWVPFYGRLMRVALGKERGAATLASQRVLPQAAQDAGYQFLHPDSAEALRSILGR
jgi:uncharacterized protein (TIGR01777 family)